MSTMEIKTLDDRIRFVPGEEVVGTVSWRLDRPAERIGLRLFWYTKGKGTEDVGIAKTVLFDAPRAQEQREFHLRLPAGPYSFSGKLISLIWALEAVAKPSQEMTRREIVLSPSGVEVLLQKDAAENR